MEVQIDDRQILDKNYGDCMCKDGYGGTDR